MTFQLQVVVLDMNGIGIFLLLVKQSVIFNFVDEAFRDRCYREGLGSLPLTHPEEWSRSNLPEDFSIQNLNCCKTLKEGVRSPRNSFSNKKCRTCHPWRKKAHHPEFLFLSNSTLFNPRPAEGRQVTFYQQKYWHKWLREVKVKEAQVSVVGTHGCTCTEGEDMTISCRFGSARCGMETPAEQGKAPDVGSLVAKLRSSLGEHIARGVIFEGPSASQLSVAPWYILPCVMILQIYGYEDC